MTFSSKLVITSWMDKRNPNMVSASDIGSWDWCPESVRLKSIGKRPGNEEVLRQGEEFHSRTARFDARTHGAKTVLVWFLIAGALMLALSFISW